MKFIFFNSHVVIVNSELINIIDPSVLKLLNK